MASINRKMVGKVTVVMDSQAGSCGKGKFVGYLALRDKPELAINNFMTNAGHTFVDNDGNKIMTQHLPTSMVNPNTVLCIGPGAAISLDTLIDEIHRYSDIIGNRYIHIHPRAMVILPEHAEKEKLILKSGSTFKGCGAAQADKIMRKPDIKLMDDYYFDMPHDIRDRIIICDTAKYANDIINEGGDVIIEGSQGFDLDINYGLDYPHVTSRQCHAGQLVADCGISPRLITDVVMIMRPYPIRISNETNIGQTINSGSYGDSKEISWDIVKERCNAPEDVEFGEMTTVTKKLRRVFELEWDRLKYSVLINRPTMIGLNFAQYIDYSIKGMDGTLYSRYDNGISYKIHDFILKVQRKTGVNIGLIGTGARNCDMIEVMESY